jgi:parvulin-like peptidyl-prolyl isomerase
MPAQHLRPRPWTLRFAVAAVGCCAVAIGAEVDPRTAVTPALAPHVPEAVSRPEGWPRATGVAGVATDKHVRSSIRRTPGAAVAAAVAEEDDAGADGVVQAAHAEPDAAEAVPLETAMVVARVGPEVVLESDLLTPKALEWLASVSSGLERDQIRQLRLQICRQVIDQHVETLLVYVDALREIPEDKLPDIRKNVDKAFDEQMLPNLMKEAKAANSIEYEKSLRAKGQSLDRMRKMFFERGLAQEWLRKNVDSDDEIPHADMIAWYQNHLADYDYPAKARFEALTVKTGLKRSRREAWDMLASMGNEVLAGRPFAEVARAKSEGPTAAAGGAFDWTTKGSLASKQLDEAVFSLPEGQLSAIIEEEQSLHVVRVVEREEAGRTPFVEAQVEIRARLTAERNEQALQEYLAKLRSRTPVWTVFDSQPGQSETTASRSAGGAARR